MPDETIKTPPAEEVLKIDAAEPAQKPAESAPKGPVVALGVQFEAAGKIYTFTTNDREIKRGERVVVEGEGGTLIATVMIEPAEVDSATLPQNVKKVLRRATQDELKEMAGLKEKALEYFILCRDKITERALPMKLVDASVEENGKKAVFVFYAEQRVDFRGLVKDLASALHMRIEMRQVGARDESKRKGCLGPCGLATCCSLHLRQFQSISISMAKHQGLAPNPAKLTGMCGKLKCCLSYEHEVYNEYRKDLPKIGLAVSSPKGAGKISSHNVLKRECSVRLFTGGEIRCPCESCKPLTQEEREAALDAARKVEESQEERRNKFAQRRSNREEKNKEARTGEKNGERENNKEKKYGKKS